MAHGFLARADDKQMQSAKSKKQNLNQSAKTFLIYGFGL
jgi:hypothetical protein